MESKQTVFSFKELTLLWRTGDQTIRSRINYYVKKGYLYPIRRGIYAKNKKYNRFEVATKILIPSYISFETVLADSGVIFQYYNEIFVASYQARSIICDSQRYTFKRMKKNILMNRKGVITNDLYSIATAERAFLDVLYYNNDYYFDNLLPLNLDLIFEILPIYQNRRMEKIVNKKFISLKENLNA